MPAVPVGTVRIHNRSNRPPSRMIKVRNDGPCRTRWMTWARWWWENNRGAIPPGRTIMHKNGDTLDDAPENLVLGATADRFYLWAARNPEESQKQHDRSRAGSARYNRERAQARRLLGQIQPSLWYLVDHDQRVITGPFGKAMANAMESAGVRSQHGRPHNARTWISPCLGWPSLSAMDAVVLAALDDGSERTITEIIAAGNAILEKLQYGRSMGCKESVYCSVVRLRRTGWVLTRRHPELGLCRGYRIAPDALQSRGAVRLLSSCKGKDVLSFRQQGYRLAGSLCR